MNNSSKLQPIRTKFHVHA